MIKNVLLINPWVHDFKLYDEWMHPFGLFSIALFFLNNNIKINYIDLLGAHIKDKNHGTGNYTSEVIPKPPIYNIVPRKYKRYGISEKQAEKEFQNRDKPDYIFITSGMTYWYSGVIETINLVRAYYKNTPIILGGIYADLCKEQAEAVSGADRIVTMDEVAGFLEEITGVVIPDMAKSRGKFNEYNILNSCNSNKIEKLVDLFLNEKNHLPLRLISGCYYNCEYCASSFLNKEIRIPDPAISIKIAAAAAKKGIKNLAFYDDALLYRFEEICLPFLKQLKQAGIEFNIHTPNGLHAELITKKTAVALKEHNFKKINIGFESSSKTLKSNRKKKANLTKLQLALKNLQQAGFGRNDVRVYLLAGMQGQTSDDISSDIILIKKMGARPVLNFLSPVPHTEYYKQLLLKYPQISDPLTHNDMYFLFGIKGYSFEEFASLRKTCNTD